MRININLVMTEKQKEMAVEIYKRKINELKKCKYGEIERSLYLMEQIQDMKILFQRNSMPIPEIR